MFFLARSAILSSSPIACKALALTLVFSLLAAPSCTRWKIRKELQLNEYFAEILKREDRHELGDDGFFQHNLLGNPFPEVRIWCAVALGRIGAPSALPWLYEALHSEYAAVRAASAFAIGEIENRELLRIEGRLPDPRARSELIGRLDDGSLAVRMRVVEALGKIGSSVEAAEIIRRLESFPFKESIVERLFLGDCITALARINDPIAVPILQKLAMISDPEIRQRAGDALARLKAGAEAPRAEATTEQAFMRASEHSEAKLDAEPLPLLSGQTPDIRKKEFRLLYPTITDAVALALASDRKKSTIALLDTTRGTIEIELFREQAPATTHRFTLEARGGRLDGIELAREDPHIISARRNDRPLFFIPLRSEINMMRFERGSVGMRLSRDSHAESFFITLTPQPFLDGVHPCFGRVISGIQTAEKIAPGDRIRRIRIKETVRIGNSLRY